MTATTESAATPRGDLRIPREPAPGPRPDVNPQPSSTFERVLVAVFVGVPFLALIAAVPLAWGWGLGWHDVVIAIAFYLVSGLGISMGLHRYFTHGSFKAVRGFKIALAVAGSLAIDGSPITAGTTSTATRRATRTRHGASATTGRRSARAWPSPTPAGCSTATSRHRRNSAPTGWPTPMSPGSPGGSRGW